MHNIEVYPDTYLAYHTTSDVDVSRPLLVCSPPDHLEIWTVPVEHTFKNSQCISLSKSSYYNRIIHLVQVEFHANRLQLKINHRTLTNISQMFFLSLSVVEVHIMQYATKHCYLLAYTA